MPVKAACAIRRHIISWCSSAILWTQGILAENGRIIHYTIPEVVNPGIRIFPKAPTSDLLPRSRKPHRSTILKSTRKADIPIADNYVRPVIRFNVRSQERMERIERFGYFPCGSWGPKSEVAGVSEILMIVYQLVSAPASLYVHIRHEQRRIPICPPFQIPPHPVSASVTSPRACHRKYRSTAL